MFRWMCSTCKCCISVICMLLNFLPSNVLLHAQCRFYVFVYLQISLLIILDHSDGIQNDMGPCAEVVMQAAERLVVIGKDRAAKTSDDVGFIVFIAFLLTIMPIFAFPIPVYVFSMLPLEHKINTGSLHSAHYLPKKFASPHVITNSFHSFLTVLLLFAFSMAL